jgi:hypothetical protein
MSQLDFFVEERKPSPKMGLKRSAYDEYIASAQWRRLRAMVIEIRGRVCEKCGSGSPSLEVHHKTYERFGRERDSDLLVVCKSCHKAADRERAEDTYFNSLESQFQAYCVTRFGFVSSGEAECEMFMKWKEKKERR